MNTLRTQIDHLTDKNIDEAFDYMDGELQNWDDIIKNEMTQILGGTKLDDVIKIVEFITNVKNDWAKSEKKNLMDRLEKMSQTIDSISASLGYMKMNSSMAKDNVNCTLRCQTLIANLKITDTIDDIQGSIKNYTSINEMIREINDISFDDTSFDHVKNLTDWIKNPEKHLSNLSNSTINEYKQDFYDPIVELKTEIQKEAKEYISKEKYGNLSNVTEVKQMKQPLKYVFEYSIALYYIILVMALIVAVVLLSACLGLLFSKFMKLIY